jgi:hypothetical protein
VDQETHLLLLLHKEKTVETEHNTTPEVAVVAEAAALELAERMLLRDLVVVLEMVETDFK